MSHPSAKRQRANTSEDPSVSRSSEEYKEIINTFEESTLRELLLSAATSSIQVGKEVIARRDAILRAERVQTIDFDHFSKSVWHELQRGDGLGGAKQYMLGLDVGVTVADTIETIRSKTPAHSSFGTKKSALVTLRKIGKSLVLHNDDTFGSEVVKSLYRDGDPQENAMLEIVQEMTDEEKTKMRNNIEWIEKVEELIDIGRRCDMYWSLNDMLSDLGVGENQAGALQTKYAGVDGSVAWRRHER